MSDSGKWQSVVSFSPGRRLTAISSHSGYNVHVSTDNSTNQKASFPYLSELPSWALTLIGILAAAGTLALYYLNPAKFPLLATATSLAVYLGFVWSLAAVYGRFCESTESTLLSNELVGAFMLVLIGFVSGGLGGAVWWLTAGAGYAAFSQAILAGGFLGALLIAFLLGGY